nr:MAG: ORF1 [Anelloviridae sp.]
MAWLPRSQWIRRRYGHYAGRARTFRRSFYQRPWFNRRRYPRSRRRRRAFQRRRTGVSKWMIVRQHNPRVAVRCTIRGWMPGLVCIPADPNFRPMKYFTLDNQSFVFRSGGWTIHELRLTNFYKEHLLYRNTWSRSNCGFDLARYRGTKITLWPTEDTDYIVWWDVDYKDEAEFELIIEKIHPALMLGRAHSRVVLSRKTSLRYRPKTIFLPPPARFKNEWQTQGEWAQRGLGLIAVSMIDLTYPWLPPKMEEYEATGAANTAQWKPSWDLWDFDQPGKVKHKQVIRKGSVVNSDKFWFNQNGTTGPFAQRPLRWLQDWPSWKKDTATQFTPLSNDNIVAVAEGPFVKKYPGSECQIIWTYKSRWTWGGDVALTSEKVCSPETLQGLRRKRALAAPEDPAGYIYQSDIRKDGFIKPKAWKRITRAAPEGIKFFNQPREETSEEETYPDPYQASTESDEETEGPSAKRPRIPRRPIYRSRLEHLQRLRYLLKHFLQNKKSFSD